MACQHKKKKACLPRQHCLYDLEGVSCLPACLPRYVGKDLSCLFAASISVDDFFLGK